MAEEKPKEPNIIERLLRGVRNPTGESPEEKADRERFNELLQVLRKEVDSRKPGQDRMDWDQIVKWLAERHDREELDAAQKKAAETNEVNETAANEWLKEHWQDRTCPVCKIVTWAMAPNFAHIPMSLLGRHTPSTSFPCVVLTCRNCGNTLFFNAIAMKQLPAGAE